MLEHSEKLWFSRVTVKGTRRSCLLSLVLIGLPSCQSTRPSPTMHADPVATSADSIPVAPVSGTIRGKQFAIATALYFIDRRPGYEHVDIKLSAGKSAQHCSSPIPDDAMSIWLRRTGSEQLDAETVHIASDRRSSWEVHYQVKDNGQWLGNSKADALFVLQPRAADQRMSGELSACFADETKSCVLGTFVADYCPISIDAPIRGMDIMEPPAARDHARLPSPEVGGLANVEAP